MWTVPTASANECVPRVGLGVKGGYWGPCVPLKEGTALWARGILVLRETYGL